MDRPIGYWLKLVDRLIDEQFDGTLDEHGVTRRQWQVLNVLSRGPATREQLDAAVAPFLDVATADDPAETTEGDVEELMESDWVTTTVAGLVLTDRGELSFVRLSEVVAGIRATLAEGVDEADYSTTTRTLERMARNLGWDQE